MTFNPAAWLGAFILWFFRVVFKADRLEHLELAPMGAPLSTLTDLYGTPLEREPSDEAEDCTMFKFEKPYHGVIAEVLDGKTVMISYWSTHGDPARDLKHAMDVYGEGRTWRVLTQGYSYIREDDELILNCSAIPAIGVTSADYREACRRKSDAKRTEE